MRPEMPESPDFRPERGTNEQWMKERTNENPLISDNG